MDYYISLQIKCMEILVDTIIFLGVFRFNRVENFNDCPLAFVAGQSISSTQSVFGGSYGKHGFALHLP